MLSTNHILLVSENNPKPDNYIAIFHIPKESAENQNGFSVFTNMDQALQRAEYLSKKYKIKQLRLFYNNRRSIIIRTEKDLL
jgi:hypothetical protein